MSTLSDIKEDVGELQKLLSVATRPKVKDILSIEIRKLETQILNSKETVEEDASKDESTSVAKEQVPVTSNKPYTKKITSYGWDQSDKFAKVYLTSLTGVQSIPKENITSEYGKKSVKVTIAGLDNKNHEFHIGNLHGEIIPGESYFKVKTDMVLVMLKKREQTTWAHINEQEKKKKKEKPKAEDSKDPAGGIMDMMRQMYDDGDDEMKRTISKAWHDSQEAKKAGGGDNLGDNLGL